MQAIFFCSMSTFEISSAKNLQSMKLEDGPKVYLSYQRKWKRESSQIKGKLEFKSSLSIMSRKEFRKKFETFFIVNGSFFSRRHLFGTLEYGCQICLIPIIELAALHKAMCCKGKLDKRTNNVKYLPRFISTSPENSGTCYVSP